MSLIDQLGYTTGNAMFSMVIAFCIVFQTTEKQHDKASSLALQAYEIIDSLITLTKLPTSSEIDNDAMKGFQALLLSLSFFSPQTDVLLLLFTMAIVSELLTGSFETTSKNI